MVPCTVTLDNTGCVLVSGRDGQCALRNDFFSASTGPATRARPLTGGAAHAGSFQRRGAHVPQQL